MAVEIEYVDPDELWQESLEWHTRAQREDEEALRSGRTTAIELKHRNELFAAFPPDRIPDQPRLRAAPVLSGGRQPQAGHASDRRAPRPGRRPPQIEP